MESRASKSRLAQAEPSCQRPEGRVRERVVGCAMYGAHIPRPRVDRVVVLVDS